MKRAVLLLAVFAALALSSCDMMFETNLFKDITHDELSAGDLASSSPAEIEALLESDVYRKEIAENPELQQAIVDNLQGTIDSAEAEPDAGTTSSPALQEAAITQAAVLLQTSAAAQVSTGLLAALPDLLSESETGMSEASVVNAFLDALPTDIADALESGSPTPPASFVSMVDAFSQAAGAYLALGGDLDDGQAAAYNIPITGEEALDIAINAAISVFVDSIVGPSQVPFATTEDMAGALWTALNDPVNAGSYIAIDSSMQDYFDDTSGSYDPAIMNLLAAAGIVIQ